MHFFMIFHTLLVFVQAPPMLVESSSENLSVLGHGWLGQEVGVSRAEAGGGRVKVSWFISPPSLPPECKTGVYICTCEDVDFWFYT